MIKIGIYCKDSIQKKEIKNFLKEYFEDMEMESNISYIRTWKNVYNNLAAKFGDYNIMFVCDEGKITYIKRNAPSEFKNYTNITTGWTELPLSSEKIDDVITSKDYHNCPCKVFHLNTMKTIRAITHAEIEYCKKSDRKSVIVLKDNETEEINETLKSLKRKLPEDYFATCLGGYIINLYNIKKIDRANRKIIMNSGHTIPIAKSKNKAFLRIFFKVIFGI